MLSGPTAGGGGDCGSCHTLSKLIIVATVYGNVLGLQLLAALNPGPWYNSTYSRQQGLLSARTWSASSSNADLRLSRSNCPSLSSRTPALRLCVCAARARAQAP